MSSLEWLTEHWQEGLDVVGVVATVVAAVLAWLAILRGNRQARAAAAALVRERRINFELEHLDRMGEALEKGPSVAFTVETIQRGLRMLPGDELPRMRARYLSDSTPEAMKELERVNVLPPGQSVWDAPVTGFPTYKTALREEIREAIRRRLAERG